VDINLNNLSLKELKDLQSQVGKAISSYEDRKKKAALAELEEVARSKGFSLAELTGATLVSDTWSGRGRKPRWFEAALKSGKRPEDLAI